MGKRVLLLSMPWASPMLPALGAALLRSILIRDGIPTDIIYGNLVFSSMLREDPIYELKLAEMPVAEVAFTPHYFADFGPEEAARVLAEATTTAHTADAHQTMDQCLRLVEAAGACLDRVMEGIDWSAYAVVGFSVMMQQTVASLALSKRIKTANPEVCIVFGGPNCWSPMGTEIIRAFSEVDYVIEGEADESLPSLVRELLAPSGDPMWVPGVIARRDGRPVRGPVPEPFERLDELPFPDFAPYFDQLRRLGMLDGARPYLQMESSRGCWWGQKHHCSFCSLDDRVTRYRSKSEARVLTEVLALAETYQRNDFFFTDSIIDHRYFRSLLPRLGQLRERGFEFTYFFEVKSNIRRAQAQALRRAGATIVQPGIESFSDRVLGIISKGATTVQQVQCLRLLAEAGVTAYWSILTGTPGEEPQDYRDVLEVLPYLHHLPPLRSDGLIPTLFMRFSPYWLHPERFGIYALRPDPVYRSIYPRDDIRLDDLAYYFLPEHDATEEEAIRPWIDRVAAALTRWRRIYRPDSLVQARGPGYIEIIDRRREVGPGGRLLPVVERRRVLTGVWAEVFAECDEVAGERAVVSRYADRLPEVELRAFLDELVRQRLMYRSRCGKLLALPLLRDADTAPASRAEPSRTWRGSRGARRQPYPALPVPPQRPDDPADGMSGPLGVDVDGALASGRLDHDLGVLTLNVGEESTAQLDMLRRLAGLRGSRLYGVRLRATVRPDGLGPHAKLLADSGVRLVLLREHGWDGSRVDEHCLSLLDAIRSLHEHGVRVEWELPPILEAPAVALLEAVPHLPPPAIGAADQEGLVDRWRWAHDHSTLRAWPGPGFVNLDDRRLIDRVGERPGRLLTLTGWEARAYTRLLEGAREVTSTGDGEASRPQLDALLHRLADLRLAVSDSGSGWVALATRRR